MDWEPGEDALPQLGIWALPGKTWAPEVIEVMDGYVCSTPPPIRRRVGNASAGQSPRSRQGHSSTTRKGPFVCQPELGGSIAPNPVRTPDGSLYLYWKSDGNCCGEPVDIWGQELDARAAALVGRPVAMLSNSQAWEGDLGRGAANGRERHGSCPVLRGECVQH